MKTEAKHEFYNLITQQIVAIGRYHDEIVGHKKSIAAIESEVRNQMGNKQAFDLDELREMRRQVQANQDDVQTYRRKIEGLKKEIEALEKRIANVIGIKDVLVKVWIGDQDGKTMQLYLVCDHSEHGLSIITPEEQVLELEEGEVLIERAVPLSDYFLDILVDPAEEQFIEEGLAAIEEED